MIRSEGQGSLVVRTVEKAKRSRSASQRLNFFHGAYDSKHHPIDFFPFQFGENVLIKLNTISKLCNDPNKEENDNCLSNEMQDFPLSSYTILVEMLKSFKLPVVSGALHPRDGCLADIVLESREGALDIQLEAELCVQKQITKATS
uniref:Venom protein n=1 Tax=Ampulex compressa TaxID=860918 RepID=A0A1W6EWB9_AMPCP|nr:venom protein [Ampulex compressa]